MTDRQVTGGRPHAAWEFRTANPGRNGHFLFFLSLTSNRLWVNATANVACG